MKYTLLACLIALSLGSAGQNLVLNGSFEDTVSCPEWNGDIDKAQHWYNCDTIATLSTPDYFNRCSGDTCPLPWNQRITCVPENFRGHQEPRTGDAYGGFLGVSTTEQNSREFMGVELSKPMVADRKYVVEFYVNLSDKSRYGIDRVGAKFSTSKLEYNFDIDPELFLNYDADVESPQGVPLTDYTIWHQVTDTFTAMGGEKFITFGCFNFDTLSFIGMAAGGTFDYGYYYVDDVSVTELITTGIYEARNSTDLKIYPNPVSDNLYFESDLKNPTAEVYDINGVVVRSNEHASSNIVDLSGLRGGTYYLILMNQDQIARKVFVKQ